MNRILKDICNIIVNRLNIFIHSKSVVTAFLISSIATGFIIMTFLDSSEEKSTVPIGIVDCDMTDTSRQFVSDMKDDNSLHIEYGNMDEVKDKLIDGEIFSMFVIEKEFEKKIMEGETKRLISDYYLEGNEKVKSVSDIVLSKIIKKVCCLYSYDSYVRMVDDEKKMSKEEFVKKIDEQFKNNEKLFAFDFEVVNTDSNKSVTSGISNGIIYRQIIIMIVGTLIAFIVLFAANMIITDKKYKTDIRLRVSLIGKMGIYFGDLISLFVVAVLFCLIADGFIIFKLGFIDNKGMAKFILLSVVFALVISSFFMILCQVLVEPVTLQFVGAVLIFVLAVSGVMQMFEFVLPKKLADIVKYLPISLLCDGYTDLIVNGKINKEICGIFVNLVILLTLGLIIQYVKSEDKRYEL